MVVRQDAAPTGPEWNSKQIEIGWNKHRYVPVVKVSWKLKYDGESF